MQQIRMICFKEIEGRPYIFLCHVNSHVNYFIEVFKSGMNVFKFGTVLLCVDQLDCGDSHKILIGKSEPIPYCLEDVKTQ